MAEMKRSKPTTRQVICCPVFGAPADVNKTMLPTNADMMRRYTMIQHEIRPTSDKKKVTVISKVLSKCIELLWCKSSIPVISHKRCWRK